MNHVEICPFCHKEHTLTNPVNVHVAQNSMFLMGFGWAH